MPETNQRKRILYLSYDGLTDPLGQAQVLPYLTGLSKRGYSITIISAEKEANYARRLGVIRQLVAEAEIDWRPVFYTKKPPVLSTLWDVRRIYRKAKALHQREAFHAVHCRSYITALVGERLKETTGLPFIFDMRGFWADERLDGGIWNLQHPVYRRIYRYFKRKERDFLRSADYTISLTYAAKAEIYSWPGMATIPIQVIPCCADTTLFAPAGNLQHSPAAFTLSYLGSLGTWYLLDEMLRFFKRLLLTKPDAQFLFITPDDPQLIRAGAKRLAIPAEAIRIRKAERNEVPELLAQSQLSVFFIKPSYSKKASSATKMGEILSMGIPVICNAGVGDTDFLFNAYQPGLLINRLDDAHFDEAIGKIDSVIHTPADQLRRAALEYFDLRKGIDLYEEVYRKVLR
jgi:glycosyltransferase involved in cell wall biosynthesis